MNRKVTELEQQLIQDGWYLTAKKYVGKHSEKILYYEYHKISDLRTDGKTYDQVIKLDPKRSQIVNYGIANLFMDFVSDIELSLIRFLHLELRHYVERITKKRQSKPIEPVLNKPSDRNWEYNESEELAPMTPEQFDELCQEKESGGD